MDTKTIKTIACTVLICLCGFFGYNHMNQDKPIGFEATQSKEEVKQSASRGIEIPGYSQIVVQEGEKKASVDFFNPEDNKVYFKINLILNDNNEKIYESKLFEPGQHLYEIELTKALQKGEYDMTIVYETFSLDESLTPRNGASVNCKLVVK